MRSIATRCRSLYGAADAASKKEQERRSDTYRFRQKRHHVAKVLALSAAPSTWWTLQKQAQLALVILHARFAPQRVLRFVALTANADLAMRRARALPRAFAPSGAFALAAFRTLPTVLPLALAFAVALAIIRRLGLQRDTSVLAQCGPLFFVPRDRGRVSWTDQ